jgi:hypothetical protein
LHPLKVFDVSIKQLLLSMIPYIFDSIILKIKKH